MCIEQISLCELSTLKTVSSSSTSVFASRFGRDKKAQLATVALFTIIRAYVDNLRESWKNVIDSLAILKKLKLLPELMQLEDIFKFKQPTIIGTAALYYKFLRTFFKTPALQRNHQNRQALPYLGL